METMSSKLITAYKHYTKRFASYILCWDSFLSLVNFYFSFLTYYHEKKISKTKNNKAEADIKLNFNSYINRSNKAQKHEKKNNDMN